MEYFISRKSSNGTLTKKTYRGSRKNTLKTESKRTQNAFLASSLITFPVRETKLERTILLHVSRSCKMSSWASKKCNRCFLAKKSMHFQLHFSAPSHSQVSCGKKKQIELIYNMFSAVERCTVEHRSKRNQYFSENGRYEKGKKTTFFQFAKFAPSALQFKKLNASFMN